MFLSKYNAHLWIEKNKGVHLYRGIDVVRPFRTKLYIESGFEYFRFIVYMVLYSYRFDRKSNFEVSEGLYFSGENTKNSKTSRTMEDYFLKIVGRPLDEVRVSDKFNFFGIIPKMFYFVLYLFRLRSFSYLSVLNSLCYSRTRHEIEKMNLEDAIDSSNYIVTFCDALGFENIAAQLKAAKKGVSITLQHGQYRVLDESNCSQDIEALYNFVSKYMLCWGQATIDEYLSIGVSRERFISVGRLIDRSRFAGAPRKHSKTNKFGVVFCGENSKFMNFELVKIANKISEDYSIGFYIRPHPSNNFSEYKELVGSGFLGVDTSDSYFSLDFSVMAMTGFFMDCLTRKHPFFVVSDSRVPDVFSKHLPSYKNNDNPYDCIDHFDYDGILEYYDNYVHQKNRVQTFLRGICG